MGREGGGGERIVGMLPHTQGHVHWGEPFNLMEGREGGREGGKEGGEGESEGVREGGSE